MSKFQVLTIIAVTAFNIALGIIGFNLEFRLVLMIVLAFMVVTIIRIVKKRRGVK